MPVLPPTYPVERAGRGRLALMAAPRGGDQLAADVAALAASGVTDVVCLLPDAELARLGLAEEPDLLRRSGIAVHRLPVPDFGVPDAGRAGPVADAVVARLAAGASVVVHCRGGVGRSSTVAACVLVREGRTAAEAWRALAAARGRAVPETFAQRAFVAGFAGEAVPAPGFADRLSGALRAVLVPLAGAVDHATGLLRRRR